MNAVSGHDDGNRASVGRPTGRRLGRALIVAITLAATVLVLPATGPAAANPGDQVTIDGKDYVEIPYEIVEKSTDLVTYNGRYWGCYVVAYIVVDSEAIRALGADASTFQLPVSTSYLGRTPNPLPLLRPTYVWGDPWNDELDTTFGDHKLGNRLFAEFANSEAACAAGNQHFTIRTNPDTGQNESIPFSDAITLFTNTSKVYLGANYFRGPRVSFTATKSPSSSLEFDFASTSTDPDGGALTYAWNFGDGGTNTGGTTSHRYDEAGEYTVTLRATNAAGLTGSATKVIQVVNDELVVNSTGDGTATDPDKGCDTGGTVGAAPVPECTLRAAIEVANASGGKSITFDIDQAGVPVINVGESLPAVSSSTTIDGTTQGAGRVGILGPGTATSFAVALQLTGGASTVKGLAISGFDGGIITQGGSGHVIENNYVGTDPTGRELGDMTIAVGVAMSPDVTVRDNVVAASYSPLVIGDGAPRAKLIDNRVAVDVAGTSPLGSPTSGISVFSANATVSGNVTRSPETGIGVIGVAASGATVTGNFVGVSEGGGAVLDLGRIGIRVDGAPGVTVGGNTVAAHPEGAIQVTGSPQFTKVGDEYTLLDIDEEQQGAVTGGGTKITGNRVGLLTDGSPAGSSAAPGVVTWAGASDLQLLGNTIGGALPAAIELHGGANHRVSGNHLGTEGADASTNPDIGVDLQGTNNARVTDANVIWANSVGVRVDATSVSTTIARNDIGGSDYGVTVAEGADTTAVSDNTLADHNVIAVRSNGTKTTISNNTITGAVPTAIEVHGDAPLVSGNHIGVESTDGANNPDLGVALKGTSSAQVTDANVVRSKVLGVGVDATSVDTTISANDLGRSTVGVSVAEGASTTAVSSNTFANHKAAAIRSSGIKTTISNNTIVDSLVGIRIDEGATAQSVSTNTLVGNGVGIWSLAVEQVPIANNRITGTAGEAASGSAGPGIWVTGKALVTKNTILKADTSGILVADGGTAELLGNSISKSKGEGIVADDAPRPPQVAAAIRRTEGTSIRTTLVITDLPDDEVGRIEVFANDNCSDPESKYVLEETRIKRPAETTRVVSIVGKADHDAYTATYTDLSGSTSALSGCEASATYPDSDGDGSPDPIDDVAGTKDNPKLGVVVTDNEKLALVVTSAGKLINLAAVDDPATGGHPAGTALPYGVINYQITDLTPGQEVTVGITDLGALGIEGSSYQKYGPTIEGGRPHWYSFDFDETTGLGVRYANQDLLPGKSVRFAVLSLRDGAVGDDDLSPNGTIVDPGAPTTGPGGVPDDGTDPTQPPATTPPTNSTTPTQPSGPTVPPAAGTTPVRPAVTASASTGSGPLARTGSDLRVLLELAAVLCVAGASILLARRRVPSRSE